MSSHQSTGSKYTNPTGDGYLGTHRPSNWTTYISIGATMPVEWTPGDTVYALDTATPGITLVARSDKTQSREGQIDRMEVQDRRGAVVRPSTGALRAIPGLEDGEDFRVYDRPVATGDDSLPPSLALVAADQDPFVE